VASILVVSHDSSFVEGIFQTLSTAGHQVTVASEMSEAADALHGALPLVALVNRDELMSTSAPAVLLARGGALMTFRTTEDAPATLPFRIRRATLADLQLPLERQRLLALVKFVETRARASGRTSDDAELVEDYPRG
jgi:DNA-binding NtrC family response regulator